MLLIVLEHDSVLNFLSLFFIAICHNPCDEAADVHSGKIFLLESGTLSLLK